MQAQARGIIASLHQRELRLSFLLLIAPKETNLLHLPLAINAMLANACFRWRFNNGDI